MKSCALGGDDPCGHRVGALGGGGNGFDANEQHEVGSETQVLCEQSFASLTAGEQLSNINVNVNIK